jgi:glutaredoxin
MTKEKNNKNGKQNIFVIVAVIVVLILVGAFMISRKNLPSLSQTPASSKMDVFAQCLKDSGAKFYGASWCSHCQNQKKLLEESKNMPYVECATSDGNKQLQICTDNKIEGYPTWIFADGSRQSGEISLDILSQKTDCALAQ